VLTKQAIQIIIGQRVKFLRKSKGITQRQLALSANKDPQSLERVENGKTSATVFYLYEICSAMEISLEEFFKDL
jgi:transcriptional regulator with XRE-family HTH domain